jgi:nucleoside-diphosphate-sugar epimerase
MVETDPFAVEENFANGYALSKIMGEALVTFLSTEWNIPTTILRICQMYGPRGGAPTVRLDRVRRGEPIPVYGDGPNPATVMFEDDYVDKLIAAASIATVPPLVTNFGGTTTTIQEYCSIAAEMLGIEVEFVTSDLATRPIPLDLTRMHALLGPPRVGVREAVARVLAAGPDERALGWGSFTLPGG